MNLVEALKKTSAFALVLLVTFVMSGLIYLYIFARSESRYMHNADWPFLPFVICFAKGIAMTVIPFFLVAISLVYASRSIVVILFSLVLIISSTYFSYIAVFEARGPDVIGAFVFAGLICYWVFGVIIYFFSPSAQDK